ncbi:hypothetical protein A3H26_01045 [candidate division WWE3 bacterium RIFCSPLOWO2_12_FULL_36_10]|uniref:Peptidase C39-like domain-containing protein n=1 Tax=candidate division WWE3 bacterium RIFCSPLOWO2_12_FULL_36_10 TaxID=1802630 RepID=A0A1F4VGK0_UNCKA|nr:MAG: hypothetical protein A3H26_01045 [candidate division WWE3 bacterium RIFCSPLOWO2_12_FULL_36_10]
MKGTAINHPVAMLPPRLTQDTNYTCGTVILRMLLSANGISNPASDKEIILAGKMKEIEQFGSHVGQFYKAVMEMYPEFVVMYKLGAGVSDLYVLLEMGILPCVGWQGIFDATPYISAGIGREDGEDGHYSIVTGVDLDTGYVSMLDPSGWLPDPLLIPTQTLERRWWDLNRFSDCETNEMRDNRDDRLAFIVVPNNPNYLVPMLNMGFVFGNTYTCR